MKSLAAVSMIALCAGLLGACAKPAGGGAGSSATASAAAPAPAPAASAARPQGDVVIDASQAPHPRAGEWEMDLQVAGMTHPVRYCAPDRPFDVGKIKTHCQSFVFQRTLTGGLKIDAACADHGMTSTMRMTVQGDFQSAYSTDVQMSMTMPGQPPRAFKTHTDYRYIGPCSPSQQAEADREAAHAASVANSGGG